MRKERSKRLEIKKKVEPDSSNSKNETISVSKNSLFSSKSREENTLPQAVETSEANAKAISSSSRAETKKYYYEAPFDELLKDSLFCTFFRPYLRKENMENNFDFILEVSSEIVIFFF